MATVRGNPVYLPYVPRTLAHARRNLLRHPELAGLHRVLAAPHRGAALDDRRAHRRFQGPRRAGGHGPRLAPQQAEQRQAAVPDPARRERLRPGGGGQGRGARRGLGGRRQGGPGVVARGHGQGQGRQARPRRLRARRRRASPSSRPIHDYPDHAQGARHGVPDGAPAPVAALAAPARDHPRAPRGGQGLPRLPRRPGLHPRRHPDLHPRGLRGHLHPLRACPTSTRARPT